MANQISDALDVFKNFLTPTADGGKALKLSAINFPYFSGAGVNANERYSVQYLWARFYEEFWEVPVSLLSGSVSTGVIYIFPKGGEVNGASNVNDPSLRITRVIPVGVMVVFFNEGNLEEYEDILLAAMKDAMQDQTLTGRTLKVQLEGVDRVRPPKLGYAGLEFSFTLTLKANIRQ